jgi:hypothetical protein
MLTVPHAEYFVLGSLPPRHPILRPACRSAQAGIARRPSIGSLIAAGWEALSAARAWFPTAIGSVVCGCCWRIGSGQQMATPPCGWILPGSHYRVDLKQLEAAIGAVGLRANKAAART